LRGHPEEAVRLCLRNRAKLDPGRHLEADIAQRAPHRRDIEAIRRQSRRSELGILELLCRDQATR
jgi:hypothetical protein